MSNEQLFYSIVGSVVLLLAGYWSYQRWRHNRAQRAAFPAAWLNILQQRLPPYRHLPSHLQEQLQYLVKMFLYHKSFIGCAGLEVNDEMRVTIAGQACLLLLNRTTNEYHNLRWIYIYPSEFVARRDIQDEAGVITHGHMGMLGESWEDGKVILSWDDIDRGARDFTDGHNVVLHEFAHQLDHESGSTNGAPILRGDNNTYKTWSTVFAGEFAELQRDAQFGEQSVLDHYGATNPAEFFAVATETFFEKPLAMQQRHAALYQELKHYYQLDPAQWVRH